MDSRISLLSENIWGQKNLLPLFLCREPRTNGWKVKGRCHSMVFQNKNLTLSKLNLRYWRKKVTQVFNLKTIFESPAIAIKKPCLSA